MEAEAKTELQLLRPFVLLIAKASTYQAAPSGWPLPGGISRVAFYG